MAGLSMPDVVFGALKLYPVFMPCLLTRFRQAEQKAGSPLTPVQAQEICSHAVGIMVSEDLVAKLEQRRGFRDLDPEHPWNEWQRVRAEADRRTTVAPLQGFPNPPAALGV